MLITIIVNSYNCPGHLHISHGWRIVIWFSPKLISVNSWSNITKMRNTWNSIYNIWSRIIQISVQNWVFIELIQSWQLSVAIHWEICGGSMADVTRFSHIIVINSLNSFLQVSSLVIFLQRGIQVDLIIWRTSSIWTVNRTLRICSVVWNLLTILEITFIALIIVVCSHLRIMRWNRKMRLRWKMMMLMMILTSGLVRRIRSRCCGFCGRRFCLFLESNLLNAFLLEIGSKLKKEDLLKFSCYTSTKTLEFHIVLPHYDHLF